MTYEIDWQAEDGYVGKSRPQTTKIKLEHFDIDMDLGDIKCLIEEMLDEDFRRKVSCGYDYQDVESLAELIYNELQKGE